MTPVYGLFEYYEREAEKTGEELHSVAEPPVTRATMLREWDWTRSFGRF
jgi:hypothetical protein